MLGQFQAQLVRKTTMNFLINLSADFQTLSSRETGMLARQQLLNKLTENQTITIDFNGQAVSPSFADELIGILARDIGFETFKTKIKMTNVSDSSKLIIKHVLNKRLSSAKTY